MKKYITFLFATLVMFATSVCFAQDTDVGTDAEYSIINYEATNDVADFETFEIRNIAQKPIQTYFMVSGANTGYAVVSRTDWGDSKAISNIIHKRVPGTQNKPYLSKLQPYSGTIYLCPFRC
jgi:hypothetical protein